MRVNGSLVVLEERCSLFNFLAAQEFDLTTIAVERNGEIVPKATYKDVLLEDADCLEIVRFVGGG
jgi:sulfur carrier protein